jgi:hypothetical protein
MLNRTVPLLFCAVLCCRMLSFRVGGLAPTGPAKWNDKLGVGKKFPKIVPELFLRLFFSYTCSCDSGYHREYTVHHRMCT